MVLNYNGIKKNKNKKHVQKGKSSFLIKQKNKQFETVKLTVDEFSNIIVPKWFLTIECKNEYLS